jgi:hypothetical protein
MRSQSKRGERGNLAIEFALVSTSLVVLLLGTTVVGMNLARSVQVAQVARDAGSMYVRGVDFSLNGNKDVVIRLAGSLNITRTGGNGVIIFSKITWNPASTCVALNLNPCNSNQHVIVQRLYIGDTSLATSRFATPNSGLLDSLGLVANYRQEVSAVANFPIQLNDGEYAYVAEAYFSSPDYDMPGFQSGTGTYARAIF